MCRKGINRTTTKNNSSYIFVKKKVNSVVTQSYKIRKAVTSILGMSDRYTQSVLL